ncbi:hypothetical protein KOR42_53250 [Thalassoglobus neptunius]|uniref:Uncharacterized protein n=1 Tax=Thalassoglobus neptunius TaxID=1938619 RepID=A0A5C5V9P0_9PLAN|nr:hypothetical protein [Thalassoglobus neptunius]TWT35001.1 hypothetical protein KOR42_53250 [Thalassoglobus neptunius]
MSSSSLRRLLSPFFSTLAIALTIPCHGLVAQEFVPFNVDSVATDSSEADWISLPSSQSVGDASSPTRREAIPVNRSTGWFSQTAQPGHNPVGQTESRSSSWNEQEAPSSGNFTLMRSRRPVRTESPAEVKSVTNEASSGTDDPNLESPQLKSPPGRQLVPVVEDKTQFEFPAASFEAGGFKSLENPIEEATTQEAPSKVHFDQQVTPVAAVNESQAAKPSASLITLWKAQR